MDEQQRVREALTYIPAHDRDTWVRMGMAVKAHFGSDGFDLWDEWGQTADNYSPSAARSVWKSIKEGGAITLASLFYEAKQNGWTPSGKYQPREMTADELAERERKAREAQERDEREAARARKHGQQIIQAAKPLGADHPYMIGHGVGPTDTLREIQAADVQRITGYAPKHEDVELRGRLIVVPIKSTSGLVGLELIDETGAKTVLFGTPAKGGYWAPAKLPDGGGEGLTIWIAEGMATTLSARAATNDVCIAARYAANLPVVASAMRKRYPKASIVILGERGGGLRFAEQAARSVDGLLAVFEGDANDLHRTGGLEAVRKALEAAQRPDPLPEGQTPHENASKAVLAGEWGDPEPIGRTDKPDPYPLDAWPGLAGRAIRQVIESAQVPPALAAHSALCGISTAAMGLADVKRAESLVSPAAIFALILCESGERKSHVDRLFMRGIEEWQSEHLEEQRLTFRRYLTEKEIWEAKRQGLLARIKKLTERPQADKEKGGNK